MRAYRIALYRLRNPDDALDVVQDAMISLVSRYARRPETEWPPLFYRILTNRIRDWQRRSTVRQKFTAWFSRDPDASDQAAPLDELADPQGRAPEQKVGMQQTMEELNVAIADLAPRQQEALLLRLVEGLDVAATATAMRCSEGSVKTHYSRAVHALRARLGEHWP